MNKKYFLIIFIGMFTNLAIGMDNTIPLTPSQEILFQKKMEIDKAKEALEETLSKRKLKKNILLTWLIIESSLAYKNFDKHEWQKMSYITRPFALILRTVKNIANRPAQIIGLPAKFIGLLESKVIHG